MVILEFCLSFIFLYNWNSLNAILCDLAVFSFPMCVMNPCSLEGSCVTLNFTASVTSTRYSVVCIITANYEYTAQLG